jgi:hypothetical protein
MTDLPTLRALLAQATPIPWTTEDRGGRMVDAAGGEIESIAFPFCRSDHRRDAALILAAVNALPALLEIAEAAQAIAAQRNGPYLMADMDRTLAAEGLLKRALRRLTDSGRQDPKPEEAP